MQTRMLDITVFGNLCASICRPYRLVSIYAQIELVVGVCSFQKKILLNTEFIM